LYNLFDVDRSHHFIDIFYVSISHHQVQAGFVWTPIMIAVANTNCDRRINTTTQFDVKFELNNTPRPTTPSSPRLSRIMNLDAHPSTSVERYTTLLLPASSARAYASYAHQPLPLPYDLCVRVARDPRLNELSALVVRRACRRQCYVPWYQVGRADLMLEQLFAMRMFTYADE
jgi:hypothetical protein